MTADRLVAVITGAASGIGRATAVRLAKDDYKVVLVDIDEKGLEKTRALVVRAGGAGEPFVVDVSDAHQLGIMIREVATRIGVPTLLVNVAGVGVAATVLETSDEDWSKVLATNLTGPFLLTRAILPLMLDHGGGVVINVASVGALIGLRARAAYCASKAGLVGLTRAIVADHAADGIRCVAVCPGTVDTEWVDRILANDPHPAEARDRMSSRQLDNRMGTPEELAATIAFIASPSGRFFNGATIVADGGMSAV